MKDIWIAGTQSPNIAIDVTGFWDKKLQALYEHRSQIGDQKEFSERMRARHTENSTIEDPVYEEAFRRIILDY